MIKGLFEGLNERGVSPVIAIVLLLMMTVAAAGAAYFWLTSMQSSMQESSRKSIENIMEASGRRVVAQATLCKPTYPYKGLIGYWMMEEGSGNKTYDKSGNENTGTLYPGPDGSITSDSGMWTDGQVGGALKFDENDSYVEVPNAGGPINSANAFAISYWVNCKEIEGKRIAYASQEGPGFWTEPMRDGNGVSIGFRDAGGTWHTLESGYVLTAGTWYHITYIWDGQYVKAFVDGEEEGSKDLGGISVDLPTTHYIVTKGWTPINGTIDEVHVYDRALSKNEIQELYDAENHSARRRIDVTVRNIGSEEIPKATWVANLKHDDTTVETDAYNASSIDTNELKTLKFYFADFKPNTEYTIDLQGTGTSTTVSC